MTETAKPRIYVVKREEKEGKLTAFILKHLEVTGPQAGARPWLLVARCAASPVVKALSAMAPALAAAGCTVNTVLTNAQPNRLETAAGPDVEFCGEVRIASDVRLLDAHEQLWLDETTSWIGDCMRREPAKRDAYESYVTECAETADWGHKAFQRIWAKAQPGVIIKAQPIDEPTPDADLDSCTTPAAQIPSTIVASTRH
jgi:hypothetical protein